MGDPQEKDTEQENKSEQKKDRALEKYRIKSALTLSIFGLSLAAVLMIALLVAGWDTATDITAVIGLFTTTLGTLVGAFFGLQIGSSGKEEAEQRADTAQKKADALNAAADTDTINKARKLYPNLFK